MGHTTEKSNCFQQIATLSWPNQTSNCTTMLGGSLSLLCKTLIQPQIYLSACCNCSNKVPTIMLCNFLCWKCFWKLDHIFHIITGWIFDLKQDYWGLTTMNLRIIYLGKERDSCSIIIMSQSFLQGSNSPNWVVQAWMWVGFNGCLKLQPQALG